MSDLLVNVDDVSLSARWSDDAPTARAAVERALPVSGDATRWGDELYFGTDIDASPENTTVEVPPGAIAYWPQGNAICLFWGPTPASVDGEPRAASPVAIVAEIEDVSPLDNVAGDARVEIDTA
ncbi:MAG: cyclophilin-like family protein [Haloarculaceae archaeon]